MMGTVYVPPLDERALSGDGVRVLQIVARRQKAHISTHIQDVNKGVGLFPTRSNDTLTALEIAGFVEIARRCELSGGGSNMGYKITEKGWQALGEKPIWL